MASRSVDPSRGRCADSAGNGNLIARLVDHTHMCSSPIIDADSRPCAHCLKAQIRRLGCTRHSTDAVVTSLALPKRSWNQEVWDPFPPFTTWCARHPWPRCCPSLDTAFLRTSVSRAQACGRIVIPSLGLFRKRVAQPWLMTTHSCICTCASLVHIGSHRYQGTSSLETRCMYS